MTKSRLLLVLILGSLATLPWLVSPSFDTRGDASIYIATAQSLLRGEGYSYMGSPFVVRPPGFSLLLTPVLASVGTQFFALNLFVHLCGVLAIALLFLYLHPRLGNWLAGAVSLAVWLSPGMRQLSNRVLGDIPGLAALLAILLLEQKVRRAPSLQRNLLLGLAIGLACYLRTALVTLIPAILLSRALALATRPSETRAWRGFARDQVAPLVLIPILLLAPWSLRNASQSPPAPAEELKLHSYAVAFWHADPGDPASPKLSWQEVAERIPGRVAQILPVLGSRMHHPRSNRQTNQVLGLVGLGCWLVILIRRREAGEFFVGGLMSILVVYFGFVDRLVLPIYVLVFANVVETFLLAAGTVVGSGRARGLTAALVLALAAVDFNPWFQWDKVAREHADFVQVSTHLNAHFPPDAPLASLNGVHLGVYAQRPVHALRWALRRDGTERVAAIVDDKAVEAVVVGREGPLRRHFGRAHPVALQTDSLTVYHLNERR